MNLRLKTSIDVENMLIELQSKLQFSTKAAVMRLAIGFSLKEKGDPREKKGEVLKYDTKKLNGQDYLRSTILGDYDQLYKMIFEEHINREISDDEFFPEMVYFHLERGLKSLDSEFRYAKNKEDFMKVVFGLKVTA